MTLAPSNQEITEEWRLAKDNTDLKHIPGSYGLPILGKGLSFYLDFPKAIRQQAARYGEVSRIQVADQKGVLLLGADDIRDVFLDRDRNFSTEMGYQKTARHFYDGGLLFRDFDEHRLQRRILQTAFKAQSLQTYMGHLNQTMRYYVREWGEKGQILFFPNSKDLLLRIGAKIFVGIEDVGQDYKTINNAFMSIADGFTDQLKKEIPGTPFYKGKRGMRTLHEFFAELIPQRREGNGDDMLSHMCRERQENGELFSDEDIVLHATFLLFAAHDTTTSVLNLLMMYLAQDQAYQQKLRELCQGLNIKDLDYEDLDRLNEIEYAANECLRLHPTIPLQIRRTIRECEFGGHSIPPNTVLMITSMYTHYDERYWSNPLQFDPARFSPERAEHKSHSFAFFPFGGGAHKCIGMHFANILVKTFVHQLLCNYTVRLPDGFEPKMNWVPLPKPASLPLIFEPMR